MPSLSREAERNAGEGRGEEKDTAQPATRNPQLETDTLQPATSTQQPVPDTIPPLSREAERNVGEGPGVRLLLFTESLPRQYITGTERKRSDKVMMIFNEPLDTISLKLLYHDDREDGFVYEWSENRDSLTAWVTDSLLNMQDSLVFDAGYRGYDKQEQRTWERDTIKFSFRHSAVKPEERTPMTITANTGRTMDLGKELTITTGLPVASLDTAKVSFYRIQDSLEFEMEFNLQPWKPASMLPGMPPDQIAARKYTLDATLMQDSSYSLRMLPGAFTGYFGFTNDSVNVDFKMNNIEKYGIIVMKVDSLHENAVLQLIGNAGKVVEERRINSPATERFELLTPGKYSFKMILDKNNNGKWDTGRYLKKIQPEPILIYGKEVTLKANWEMEENWIIEPL
jgi:hypothetical protein